jgi:nitrite reductase/ring-hydroxylating ferredoxin subunit
MAKEVFVAKAAEFKEGDRRIVVDGKTEIGVYRLKGQLYAYLNLCPHQGGPACEGMLMAKVEEDLNPDMTSNGLKFNDDEIHIVCPWHGFEFKIETGEHAGDPKWKLRKFQVLEKGGDIYVAT